VELALIKLNFLQQAIELSMEDGQVVKKKLVDTHYPIKTKRILPLGKMVVNEQAKLIIETAPSETPTAPISSAPTTTSTTTDHTTPAVSSNVASTSTESGNKKNLLAALQQKYGSQYKIEEVKDSIPLNIEALQQCWNEYTQYLEKNLKHSSAGTFKLAQLNIEDEVHFTVTVSALTAQKFVEQERMNFMEKVWEQFQNRGIQFSILVDAGEKEDVPLHLKLNSKQKFERIAQQYPLVNELKTRLNLEIFY
jgi:DNA polymerase-3 subunit gamma/tau